jgi:magnesium-transporting ATPase (P-type)
MATFNMRQHAQRVTYFVTVQLIALVGWILVQSFFSLSPIGRTIPFAVVIVVEAIWWIATLVIMFVLFQREYSRFVQAALELEDANRRLREVTNTILGELGSQGNQEERALRPDERKP